MDVDLVLDAVVGFDFFKIAGEVVAG